MTAAPWKRCREVPRARSSCGQTVRIDGVVDFLGRADRQVNRVDPSRDVGQSQPGSRGIPRVKKTTKKQGDIIDPGKRTWKLPDVQDIHHHPAPPAARLYQKHSKEKAVKERNMASGPLIPARKKTGEKTHLHSTALAHARLMHEVGGKGDREVKHVAKEKRTLCKHRDGPKKAKETAKIFRHRPISFPVRVSPRESGLSKYLEGEPRTTCSLLAAENLQRLSKKRLEGKSEDTRKCEVVLQRHVDVKKVPDVIEIPKVTKNNRKRNVVHCLEDLKPRPMSHRVIAAKSPQSKHRPVEVQQDCHVDTRIEVKQPGKRGRECSHLDNEIMQGDDRALQVIHDPVEVRKEHHKDTRIDVRKPLKRCGRFSDLGKLTHEDNRTLHARHEPVKVRKDHRHKDEGSKVKGSHERRTRFSSPAEKEVIHEDKFTACEPCSEDLATSRAEGFTTSLTPNVADTGGRLSPKSANELYHRRIRSGHFYVHEMPEDEGISAQESLTHRQIAFTSGHEDIGASGPTTSHKSVCASKVQTKPGYCHLSCRYATHPCRKEQMVKTSPARVVQETQHIRYRDAVDDTNNAPTDGRSISAPGQHDRSDQATGKMELKTCTIRQSKSSAVEGQQPVADDNLSNNSQSDWISIESSDVIT